MESDMHRLIKYKLALGFIFALSLFAINGAFSYYNTQRLIRNQQWVSHTHEVLNEIESTLSLVKDAETGTRGFVITGKEEYLEPYNSAVREIEGNLAPLAKLVSDNPGQTLRVKNLHQMITDRLAICKEVIQKRREGGFANAQSLILIGEGKREMDNIRKLVSTMKDEEQTLLEIRATESASSARLAIATILAGTIANIALLIWVYRLLARAELQRVTLESAYSRLTRLEGMRDSLTAMLVHDLRTPLTTMLGSLEMLQDDSMGPMEPELQKEIIGMSAQGGHRLLNLINELLDISKMEAGEMKLRLETVRVDLVVSEAIKQVAALNMGDRAKVQTQIAPDLPLIQADQEIVTRVLINLIGNALKFTPREGTVTVGVRLANPKKEKMRDGIVITREMPLGEEDDVMLFFVQDTGEGIPEEDIGKIFDKFGQVESRKAGRKMSTGLGLTFCRLATEAHGGRIWVESELGKGSTFLFTVPLREAPAQSIIENSPKSVSV